MKDYEQFVLEVAEYPICWSGRICGQRWQIKHVAHHTYAVETQLEVRYGDIETVTAATCPNMDAAWEWLMRHWRDLTPETRRGSYTED